MELLADFGYWGLFLSGFLAGSILPASSEAVLLILASYGYQPLGLLAFATAGNVLGAVFNFWIGWQSKTFLLEKVLRMPKSAIDAALARSQKYGVWAMLFAWMPVIGDPLTIVAGVIRMNFWIFLVLVTIGKFARYYVLLNGYELIFGQ